MSASSDANRGRLLHELHRLAERADEVSLRRAVEELNPVKSMDRLCMSWVGARMPPGVAVEYARLLKRLEPEKSITGALFRTEAPATPEKG